MESRKEYSLYEVTTSIKSVIEINIKQKYWIKAEINRLNYYPASGHCYPELVEKKDGKIIAQIKGIIWRDNYLRINENFKNVLKEPLKDGIKILMYGRVTYDQVYGLSLNIEDIDVSFSLGDLEREKNETIEKLKKEGIFNNNKNLQFPLLPKRIAVISAETSNGFMDFKKVLDENQYGYKFLYYLFPAVLQGDDAIRTISYQLEMIKLYKKYFDVVVIVRGGGGHISLSCYNNYQLVKAIVDFPLPILTGIGHSTNETVVEMVANKNAITPTKLGEILVDSFYKFHQSVLSIEGEIIDFAQEKIDEAKSDVKRIMESFRMISANIILEERGKMILFKDKLTSGLQLVINNNKRDFELNKVKLNNFLRQMLLLYRDLINKSIDGINIGSKMILSSNKNEFHFNNLRFKNNLLQILSLHNTEINHNIAKIRKGSINFLEKNKILLIDNIGWIKKVIYIGVIALSKNNYIQYYKRFIDATNKLIESLRHSIEIIERMINNMDPRNVLKRGYSITYNKDGKVVKSVIEVKGGNEIKTVLYDGEFNSIIKNK